MTDKNPTKTFWRGELLVVMLLSLISTGCLAPPILFPKTTGKGVVVDQFDSPIPNVPMRAYWQPVRIFYMFAPASNKDFLSGQDGTWMFGVRKCSTGLIIEAMPPSGYELITGEKRSVEIPVGTMKTNIVLRLQKTTAVPMQR
jgi:hypothetical protein